MNETATNDNLGRVILICLLGLVVGDPTYKEHHYHGSLLGVDSAVENSGVVSLF